MADIIPFRAVRPPRDKVHLVASRSYVSYSNRDLKEKLDTNPFSFIHIINPEYDQKVRSKPNSSERFLKVRKRYEEFLDEEYFQKDDKEAFYIYRQIKGEESWTGIIAGAGVEDYKRGVIKKHEHTLSKREQVFKSYLEHTRFHAEPVLLTYPDNDIISTLIQKHTGTRAEYEFSTTDQVTHLLWVVDNPNEVKKVRSTFQEFSSIYIADGHHRSASSALMADEAGKDNQLAQYFMAYFIPESNLQVLPFHRIVKTMGGLTEKDLIERLDHDFKISKIAHDQVTTLPLHHYQMMAVTQQSAWLLEAKKHLHQDDPIEQLDAWILSEYILAPHLGVEDLRTDKRVEFRGGAFGRKEAKELVDSKKAEVAFILPTISVDQIKSVADNNLFMPPKSTWIEPKLRSGVTIYEF